MSQDSHFIILLLSTNSLVCTSPQFDACSCNQIKNNQILEQFFSLKFNTSISSCGKSLLHRGQEIVLISDTEASSRVLLEISASASASLMLSNVLDLAFFAATNILPNKITFIRQRVEKYYKNCTLILSLSYTMQWRRNSFSSEMLFI